MFQLVMDKVMLKMDQQQELTAQHDRVERKYFAIEALRELVEGPVANSTPQDIPDAPSWVRMAFHAFRSGMADNDPRLPSLARIEHDFCAALMTLNFDDQQKQLRQSLEALRAFSK